MSALFTRREAKQPRVAGRRSKAWLVVGLGSLTLLGACSNPEEELQAWMDEQKRTVRPTVKPLDAPKKFDPQAYASADGVDPYSTQKLTVALKLEARQPNSLIAAELDRRREPLEAYPLDSMTMVGSVSKLGRPYALLKVDELLYQVKVGDYMGQNYGRITSISETELTLREIVQDAAGEWVERMGTLQLQEKAR